MGEADAPPLDALLHQATRARIMAYLYRNRQAGFAALRDELGLTGGNLAGHASKLEAAGYIEARRVLASVFEVRYFITPRGMDAFRRYVTALRKLIDDSGASEA